MHLLIPHLKCYHTVDASADSCSVLQVPCDPKMLITPLDTEGISKFQLTTLEKEMRHDLLLDSGSGIQISMLDIDRYIVPEDPPPLEPEDAALLLVSPRLHSLPAEDLADSCKQQSGDSICSFKPSGSGRMA